MAKLGDYKAQKARDILKASNARPERPNIQEQDRLDRTLLEAKNYYPDKERKINDEMLDELSTKWKGNEGGSGGDALISGLKAGFKEGSFIEDKKRHKQVIDFTQKMRDMVADQNIKLFQEEKEFNAIQKVTPRITAYLESYKNMSPSDRKVYLQNTIEELNQAAGKNYKLIDTIGSEPWKVMVSEDGYPAQLDLMDVIKTPEQKKTEYYYNSNEMKGYESELQGEDALQRRVMESKIAQNQARVQRDSEKAEMNSPQRIQEKKQKMVDSGEIPEGALLFDELPKEERQAHMKYMMEERDKAKPAEAGLEALDGMEKIFEKYPKLSTSLAKWAHSKNNTPFENLINDAVNQDERSALQELEKHSSTLALGTLQQFKGQRPTDITKKLIVSTTPNSNFTPGSFKPVKEKLEKGFNKQIYESEKYSEGLAKRYVPPYRKIGADSNAKSQQTPSVDINAAKIRLDELKRKKQEIESRRQGIQ